MASRKPTVLKVGELERMRAVRGHPTCAGAPARRLAHAMRMLGASARACVWPALPARRTQSAL